MALVNMQVPGRSVTSAHKQQLQRAVCERVGQAQ